MSNPMTHSASDYNWEQLFPVPIVKAEAYLDGDDVSTKMSLGDLNNTALEGDPVTQRITGNRAPMMAQTFTVNFESVATGTNMIASYSELIGNRLYWVFTDINGHAWTFSPEEFTMACAWSISGDIEGEEAARKMKFSGRGHLTKAKFISSFAVS